MEALKSAPYRAQPAPATRQPNFTEVEPEQNTFNLIQIDVTHRCNMQCANCYLPNRDIPDLDITRLDTFLARLPSKVTIRIIGAEPTMRRDLAEIIAMVIRRGHRPILATNGLRLARRAYVEELRDAGLRYVYLSMNGADNDDWYERIDNLRCAVKKMRAAENILSSGMQLGTGTILMRGVNERAIARMLQIVEQLSPAHTTMLRFKNVGALGRFDLSAENRNLSMAEMVHLSALATGRSVAAIDQSKTISSRSEQCSRLFLADPDAARSKQVWLKLTDWNVTADGVVDPGSERRGRLTENFRIAPAMEHIKANEGGY